MYTVSLPLFEGPLDLLLHLIERRELDVTKVALAAVTDDYLRTIREMEQVDPEHVADFLVVAARLLFIKSSLLLPTEQSQEAEEDEGAELARTLEIYRQYKQVATHLAERAAEGLHSYPRVAPPPTLERRLHPGGGSLEALYAALQALLREQEEEPENVDEVVHPIRVSVRRRIHDLTTALRRGDRIAFRELLSPTPGRQEIIATFLAMLELLKLGWIRVQQEGLWGHIHLLPIPEAIPDEETEQAPAEINEYV
ncbi:MAG: segregation and condensation protein A [Ardenticatenaceae bacterium]